jgi:hypothetical protein
VAALLPGDPPDHVRLAMGERWQFWRAWVRARARYDIPRAAWDSVPYVSLLYTADEAARLRDTPVSISLVAHLAAIQTKFGHGRSLHASGAQRRTAARILRRVRRQTLAMIRRERAAAG